MRIDIHAEDIKLQPVIIHKTATNSREYLGVRFYLKCKRAASQLSTKDEAVHTITLWCVQEANQTEEISVAQLQHILRQAADDLWTYSETIY
jgi:hypothetical protein